MLVPGAVTDGRLAVFVAGAALGLAVAVGTRGRAAAARVVGADRPNLRSIEAFASKDDFHVVRLTFVFSNISNSSTKLISHKTQLNYYEKLKQIIGYQITKFYSSGMKIVDTVC